MELFRVEPEMTETVQSMNDEDLISFTEMHGAPSNDTETELLIYLLFLIFQRGKSGDHLKQALMWAEGWTEATSLDDPDRKRRLEIFDFLTAEQSNGNGDVNRETNSDLPMSRETLLERMSLILSDEFDDRDPYLFPDWIPPLEWLRGVIEMIQSDVERRTHPLTLGFTAFLLRCIYLRTKDLSDLVELTQILELLYRSTSAGGVIPRELGLLRLGQWSERLFELRNDLVDLDRAIWAYRNLVQSTPDDHRDRRSRLHMVGMALLRKFDATNLIEDLDATIEAAEATLRSTLLGSFHHGVALHIVAMLLSKRAVLSGQKDDLDRAIELLKPQFDEVTSQNVTFEAVQIYCQLLWTRSELVGDTRDLDLGILTTEQYLEHGSHNDQERVDLSITLGSFLTRRFERIGDAHDIEKGIAAIETSLNSDSVGGTKKAWAMQTLGSLQGLQFQQREDLQQLEACIANIKSAMDLSPAKSSLQSACLTNLTSWYIRRYEATGQVDDINFAIRMLEESRQSFESDDSDKEALCHNNMGTLLSKRFQCLGDIEDLNRAITFAREAIEKTQESSPARAICLGNLGTCLRLRFEQTESMSDLNEFVEAFEVSLKGFSPSDENSYIDGMVNLGTGLLIQYSFTGSKRDINRAIQLLGDAVDRTVHKNSRRARFLINLGSALVRRFKALSTTNDLTRAISCAREAMDIIPPGHPDRQRMLKNLADWLSERAEKTGCLEELDQALEISRLALSTTTSGDPYHPHRAHTVASILIQRYRRTHVHEDISDAIKTLQFAIDCVQGDDESKSRYLGPMSIALAERFEHTGDIADLDRAIQIVRQVLDTMHAESYDRSGTFQNLAGLLRTKTMGEYTAESRQQVLDAELAGFNCANGPPSIRIYLGRNAAAIYASRSDWVAANNIMKEVIRLISSVSPRALSNRDKQASLEEATALDGLASMAAAISLNAGDEPQDALQLLEHGHGIIGGGLSELRTEISDLKSAHPDLAQKFEHIRNQLDLPEQLGNELDNASGGLNRRHILEDSLTCTIEEIRGLPGLESFLCPLTENQIKSAANMGPLVFVNAGHYRCDAFIVQEEKIGLVPLPDVDVPKTLEMASKLRTDTVSVLEWLWNSIANPVLNYLGFQQKPSDGCWPHIWWGATGLMSWFPLHAAGIYTYPSEETVLDRVISSYTSSVKSLIYSRKHRSQPSDAKDALLVSMPQTSGMSALPSAATEVQMLREICHKLGLQPVEPAYPTRDNVLAQLKKSKIFHFAGHGLSDPREPSRSCLVVHDWEQNRLTVGDLRDLRLHEEAPFLSYLSACSTTSTSRDKLIDEGIHLVNACQLAGFRHVVGTLWEVSDEHCVDVAIILYSTLREKGLTDEAVYYGLHRAVRCLRDKDLRGGNSPLPPGPGSGIVEEQPNDGDQPKPATSTTPGELSLASSSNQESKGRTAVLKRKPKHQPRWYWVPYVHFGV